MCDGARMEYGLRPEASGLGQVVLVAAGMDTRAFRLAWRPGTRLFEVERAEQLARKASRLADAVPACERICVVADLTADWLTALIAAGFAASEPTLWLLEGVVMYFTAEAVHALLAALSSASAPGSRLGVDMIGTAIAKQPHQPFGCDDPAGLIEPFGWRCTVTQPGEPRARFGRWLHPPPPPGVLPAHRSWFVVGER